MRGLLNRRVVIALIIVAVLILSRFTIFQPIQDSARVSVAPASNLLNQLFLKIQRSLNVLLTIKDLANENTALRAKVTELESKLAELEFMKGENEKLRLDLGFKNKHREFSLVAAQVINYSPSGLTQAVTINRGTKDGLSKGQAVVSSGFLVGTIGQVSSRTAQVWLLSNRNLLIPVLLTDTQTIGLLKGNIRGLIVENIPLDTPVKEGATIVTSALEGKYPAGIAVGRVEEVISSQEEIFMTLRISSPINISNLNTVFVVSQT